MCGKRENRPIKNIQYERPVFMERQNADGMYERI